MTCVQVTDQEGVALVTLNRPPANALAPDLLVDALDVLATLEADQPAAVVLTGHGESFSGGADLRLVPSLSQDEASDMARNINRLFSGWYSLSRP